MCFWIKKVREEHQYRRCIERCAGEHIDWTCGEQFGSYFIQCAGVFDCLGVSAPSGCAIALVQGGFAPCDQINRGAALGLLARIR